MDFPEDGFKGFGDGFEGFPKRLPEDCVEYTIYIIDTKLKTTKEVLARLEAVRKESLKLAERLLKEYIWQRESFKLELESGDGRMYLCGVTNYGDSVEDEWLIVYILRELSNTFPDLWIKVVDTDGEFLLIEAANALPRWLNPEIADNRVWIHHNKLRIIPLLAAAPSLTATGTTPISRPLSLNEAIQTITSTPEKLINSPLVEEEAFYRLRNYPEQISASLHHSQIQIPRKLAYILHDRPASIAPAVEAFYLRDPIALKALNVPSSNIEFPPEDIVIVSTRFTKVLYAQLKSQQFTPPLIWKDLLAKSEKGISKDPVLRKKYEQMELGMKVTSGFEMLLKDPKNGDNRIVRELNILLEDLKADNYSDLPSDDEISKWKDVTREDDDSWMDINFEDFENELQGEKRSTSKGQGSSKSDAPSGFGDAKTQADLKKIVERFEAFLNDETAGPEGVEMDDMDFDDDEEEDEEEIGSEDSEDEDKDVSFDEKEFARMMREMMGMPSEEDEAKLQATTGKPKSESSRGIRNENSSDEEGEDEASEIRKVMERMEAELNEAGALNLDPTPSKLSALKGKSKEITELDDSEDEDDGEVNIDFNLARNLLESFKSQAGIAGPGGNILAMMGMQLPRDEDDVPEGKGAKG